MPSKLPIATLENLIRADQQNHQTKVDAGLCKPRIVLTDDLMRRLAEKALEIPDFPNYADYFGPCGCMGNERSTDPGCYCVMRSMLYDRRFEVALFLAKNPDFKPVEYVRPNAVVILPGQPTIENMKTLRHMFPQQMSLVEVKKALTEGIAFKMKCEYDIVSMKDRFDGTGIQVEMRAVP